MEEELKNFIKEKIKKQPKAINSIYRTILGTIIDLKIPQEIVLDYIECSRKDEVFSSLDFLEGGNYIRTREGKQIFPEDIADIGSLIMFDGGITHWVQDVDPDSVLNLESSSGRFAAFVNLYEVPIRS